MQSRPTPTSFLRLAAAAAAAVGLGLVAGCVKVESPNARQPMVTKTSGFPNSSGGRSGAAGLPGDSGPGDPPLIELPDVPTPPNALDSLAPSEAKLQEIGGLLLMYYGYKKTLPARLEDLAPLADAARPLDLTCPDSGQPYVYVRQALNPAIGGQKLVAYAPTVGKDGRRPALMVSLVATARGTTPTAGVTRLTDAQFRQHLPRPGAAAPPGPAAGDNPPAGAGAAAR